MYRKDCVSNYFILHLLPVSTDYQSWNAVFSRILPRFGRWSVWRFREHRSVQLSRLKLKKRMRNQRRTDILVVLVKCLYSKSSFFFRKKRISWMFIPFGIRYQNYSKLAVPHCANGKLQSTNQRKRRYKRKRKSPYQWSQNSRQMLGLWCSLRCILVYVLHIVAL